MPTPKPPPPPDHVVDVDRLLAALRVLRLARFGRFGAEAAAVAATVTVPASIHHRGHELDRQILADVYGSIYDALARFRSARAMLETTADREGRKRETLA